MKIFSYQISRKALATGFAILVLGELAAYFFDGFLANGPALIGIMIFGFLRYLSIGFLLLVLGGQSKGKHHAVIGLITLLVMSFLPKTHIYTAGGLASMAIAGPEHVQQEATKLLDHYPELTHFGQSLRPPLDNPLPKSNLPPLLQSRFFHNVLVMEHFVALEKGGLEGVFRGYIVFEQGYDIWLNQGDFVKHAYCNGCWTIRIADSVYWHHANPNEVPIFLMDLE